MTVSQKEGWKELDRIWLLGSVSTSRHLTEFCYDEGEVFTVTCHLKNARHDKKIWWNLYDENNHDMGDESESLMEYQRSSGEHVSWIRARLSLAKRHDNWLLKCHRAVVNDDGHSTTVDGSIAVRFRLRRDDACQG
ncbi:hypothetical protein EVAR_61864_1 [Eumeta japonica]|uniref:Ig-like domain-containing protein n=1 Tax=Eumeta variegata TaxID=151549 RepID=A0A4C1ZDJ6_EUMVA|nr:hypothetical protein EVAR_61864_1 [Eumeta japonica]